VVETIHTHIQKCLVFFPQFFCYLNHQKDADTKKHPFRKTQQTNKYCKISLLSNPFSVTKKQLYTNHKTSHLTFTIVRKNFLLNILMSDEIRLRDNILKVSFAQFCKHSLFRFRAIFYRSSMKFRSFSPLRIATLLQQYFFMHESPANSFDSKLIDKFRHNSPFQDGVSISKK